MTQTVQIARYRYRGYWRMSHCRLRVFEEAGKPTVVIATERDDNPGTSVTNVVESLAWQVWCWLEKPADEMIWVEHYMDRAKIGGRPMFKEHFDIVTFDKGPNGRYRNPRWRRVSKQDIEQIIGQPLP